MGWAFWHFFHGSDYEYFPGNLFIASCGYLAGLFRTPTIPQVRDMLRDTQHYAVDWPYIQYCGTLIGHYFKYPIAAILALLAYYLMAATPKTAFKKAYTLDRLILAQVKMWPVIAPIIRFNPAQDNSRDPNGDPPDKLPLFAESLSPQEWLKFYSHWPRGDRAGPGSRCPRFCRSVGAALAGAECLALSCQGAVCRFRVENGAQTR